MAPEEPEGVVRVWRRSREHALPEIYARTSHALEEDLAFFTGVVARDYEIWVAVEDGRILGLLAVGNGRIDRMYVDPDAQGRGIGTVLLAKAKERSPEGLTLFTHQANQRARDFYERHGFRAVAFGTSPPPEDEPDVTYAWP